MASRIKYHYLFILLFLFLTSIELYAQDKLNIKFGKISPEDFQINPAQVDTSFGAVIIGDIGNSSFQGNQKGFFSLVFTRFCRIKIINKKGYDLANLNIPLYHGFDGNEERISSFKASTYTLENGKVVENKMQKDAKFTEKVNDHISLKKFSFPNVKDGCILEFNYTIISDYFSNFQPWKFQSSYPCLWSEYGADIPEFFIYDIQYQGFLKFDINNKFISNTSYNITFNGNDNFSQPETAHLNSNNNDYRWVIKNAPPLKEEKFTSTVNNYLSRLDFQLSGTHFPNNAYHDYRGSWKVIAEKLLSNNDFGSNLNRDNDWMKDELSVNLSKTLKPLEKAQDIYNYVKTHMKWNGENDIRMEKDLKEAFKKKSGNTAEINLLLVAILRQEKFQADPVILSTRSNGFVSPIFPLIDRYNYVICKVTIDSTQYLLDASRSYLGFGNIPVYCYNGLAKVIKENPEDLDLSADSIKNVQITHIELINDSKSGPNWKGNYNSTLGKFTSYSVRNSIQENGQDAFIKKLKESIKSDILLDSLELVNENIPETPIGIKYNLQIKSEDNPSIIYLNPMLSEGIKENPFKSAERFYPVEMPYTSDEIYTIRIEIPKGYKVDEFPQSIRYKLNNNYGYFDFLSDLEDGHISFGTRIKLNKANFTNEDYEALRNFYDFIVKKDAEQIVFKKI